MAPPAGWNTTQPYIPYSMWNQSPNASQGWGLITALSGATANTTNTTTTASANLYPGMCVWSLTNNYNYTNGTSIPQAANVNTGNQQAVSVILNLSGGGTPTSGATFIPPLIDWVASNGVAKLPGTAINNQQYQVIVGYPLSAGTVFNPIPDMNIAWTAGGAPGGGTINVPYRQSPTVWNFRYNSSLDTYSSSATPWMFIGGPELRTEWQQYTVSGIGSRNILASTGVSNLGGNVPMLVLPFAGWYNLNWSGLLQATSSVAIQMYMSINIFHGTANFTAIQDGAGQQYINTSSTNSFGATLLTMKGVFYCPSANAVAMPLFNNLSGNTSSGFEWQQLSALPISVRAG
jgi:hypothetical protein